MFLSYGRWKKQLKEEVPETDLIFTLKKKQLRLCRTKLIYLELFTTHCLHFWFLVDCEWVGHGAASWEVLHPGEVISILHHLGDCFATPSHFNLVTGETLINRNTQFIQSDSLLAAFESQHANGMFVLRHWCLSTFSFFFPFFL